MRPSRIRSSVLVLMVLGLLVGAMPSARAETIILDRGKDTEMTVGEARPYLISGSGNVANGFSLSTNFNTSHIDYDVVPDLDTLASQWLSVDPNASRASQEGFGADLSVFHHIDANEDELVAEVYQATALVRMFWTPDLDDRPGDFRGRLKIQGWNGTVGLQPECVSDVVEPSLNYVPVSVTCQLPPGATSFKVAFRARQQDRLLGGSGLGQGLPTDRQSNAGGEVFLRELTVTRLQ